MPPSNLWQPGQSGNPAGRPPLATSAAAMVAKMTNNGQLLLDIYLSIATDESAHKRDRQAAADALADRLWGKPAQSIELSGASGGPIVLQWHDGEPVE